ncbi:MAG: hypothetical protein H2056_00610 [Sphingopyxis sp.]|nr:hypothetical protein [Sphingopyxis sp.]
MKFDFPPRAAHRDSAIRPGFDVLLAVTGARQAASPTARLVAGRCSRDDASSPVPHGSLLPPGRTSDGQAVPAPARFADVALGTVPNGDGEGVCDKEMKSPFTKAFQPMVKHDAIEGPLNTERPDGDGPGME